MNIEIINAAASEKQDVPWRNMFRPLFNIIFAKQNGVKPYPLPFSLVYAIILLNSAKIMH